MDHAPGSVANTTSRTPKSSQQETNDAWNPEDVYNSPKKSPLEARKALVCQLRSARLAIDEKPDSIAILTLCGAYMFNRQGPGWTVKGSLPPWTAYYDETARFVIVTDMPFNFMDDKRPPAASKATDLLIEFFRLYGIGSQNASNNRFSRSTCATILQCAEPAAAAPYTKTRLDCSHISRALGLYSKDLSFGVFLAARYLVSAATGEDPGVSRYYSNCTDQFWASRTKLSSRNDFATAVTENEAQTKRNQVGLNAKFEKAQMHVDSSQYALCESLCEQLLYDNLGATVDLRIGGDVFGFVSKCIYLKKKERLRNAKEARRAYQWLLSTVEMSAEEGQSVLEKLDEIWISIDDFA
ncbi:7f94f34f-8a43-4fe0-96ee-15ed3a9f1f30 [Sclerotinia trifoliorum]|uniref:7f94f34f-8a43-4fe0-96ee-15ed3a9f1f30 n=1 Tax=Sclerotinia trifoliorum TaxID=28548 RepID=A0A8H2W3T8_9HELO|nr:7f94f34f-8a43-4fe0-96ee-15ed3a9f1f30 [Sclerotinia trifoliorum]